MITPEENDLLCLVEGDTAMGGIMRSHWIPACMSEEVAERDGKPARVRLLGEDMVVFRDTEGRIGAIDEFCRHRGASLAFGRNEDCGLRCLYHGWKFDVNGNVLDMPSEPNGGEGLKEEAKIGILAGSIISAILGYVILRLTTEHPNDRTYEPDPDRTAPI